MLKKKSSVLLFEKRVHRADADVDVARYRVPAKVPMDKRVIVSAPSHRDDKSESAQKKNGGNGGAIRVDDGGRFAGGSSDRATSSANSATDSVVVARPPPPAADANPIGLSIRVDAASSQVFIRSLCPLIENVVVDVVVVMMLQSGRRKRSGGSPTPRYFKFSPEDIQRSLAREREKGGSARTQTRTRTRTFTPW